MQNLTSKINDVVLRCRVCREKFNCKDASKFYKKRRNVDIPEHPFRSRFTFLNILYYLSRNVYHFFHYFTIL